MFGRALIIAVVVLAALFVSVALLADRGRRARSTGASQRSSPTPRIVATRVQPEGAPSGEVECASLAPVKFTYQVYNRGSEPITGLKLGFKCACEVVGEPPQEILPGESAPVRFRLRGPYVGKLLRKIPLLSSGSDEPLAILDVWMRVKFETPGLVPPPNGLSATFVTGDKVAHDLVLEAIEAQGSAPWLRGVEFSPAESIEVEPSRVEDLREADADLIRRRYHFPLVNRSLPIGRRHVTATVQTRHGSPGVKEPLVLWVDVVDSVAIVPNPLVIKYPQGSSPPSRRVLVVDRTGNQPLATAMKFDHDLLRVEAAERQGASTAAFDVAAVETPDSVRETQVVFNVGGDDTRSLVIRFEPSERR